MASLSPLWVKITDFGISKRWAGTALRTTCGTLCYRAPETLKVLPKSLRSENQPQDWSIDIWAFGSIIHEVLTSEIPFLEFNEPQTGFSDCSLETEPTIDMSHLVDYCAGRVSFPIESLTKHDTSVHGIDFVKSLMVPDPTKRVSAAEALQSVWLTELQSSPNTTRSPPMVVREPAVESKSSHTSSLLPPPEGLVVRQTGTSSHHRRTDGSSHSGITGPFAAKDRSYPTLPANDGRHRAATSPFYGQTPPRNPGPPLPARPKTQPPLFRSQMMPAQHNPEVKRNTNPFLNKTTISPEVERRSNSELESHSDSTSNTEFYDAQDSRTKNSRSSNGYYSATPPSLYKLSPPASSVNTAPPLPPKSWEIRSAQVTSIRNTVTTPPDSRHNPSSLLDQELYDGMDYGAILSPNRPGSPQRPTHARTAPFNPFASQHPETEDSRSGTQYINPPPSNRLNTPINQSIQVNSALQHPLKTAFRSYGFTSDDELGAYNADHTSLYVDSSLYNSTNPANVGNIQSTQVPWAPEPALYGPLPGPYGSTASQYSGTYDSGNHGHNPSQHSLPTHLLPTGEADNVRPMLIL